MASKESLATTPSVWRVDVESIERRPLDRDLETDAIVLGGGIAGLSTAYELARAGTRVVVLESRELGGGNTGLTTAHLTSAIDDRFFELERLHGGDGARLAYESHARAVERIAEIVASEGIDCDLQRVDGYLFLAPEHGRDLLERELAAAHRAGFSDCELLEQAPDATFATGPCLRFPGQGRFHALRYLAGLAAAIERAGGLIFTGTHVTDGGGGPAWARSREGHTVRGRTLVMATNSPILDRVALHTKQEPYRTYVVAGAVAAGAVPDQLLWDTGDPYHYVRLQRLDDGRTMLIVGGEDHRTGDGPEDPAPFARLSAWARERFPVGELELRWSGQVYEPVDGVAFIGRNPGDDDVLVATGDSGQGMTHGTIAGLLLADLALGRENEWASLYDPSRRTLRAVGEMTRGGIEVAREYAEWVTGAPGQVDSAAEIAPGGGGIVRRGARPLAVYRDQAGQVHVRSAVCRHLGCIVHWNAVERSWDCGCHGSRYAATGEVIQGPARSDLEAVEEEEGAA